MTGVYQNNFSSVSFVRKGHCPMHPSCSQFSKIACEKYGVISGGVLTTDRLMRCGRDETKKLKIVNIENRLLFYDPVPDLKENSNDEL
jgi:putative component of membrane protein insertase Oxa1/YidC/SpoIIIJ protein YidD